MRPVEWNHPGKVLRNAGELHNVGLASFAVPALDSIRARVTNLELTLAA